MLQSRLSTSANLTISWCAQGHNCSVVANMGLVTSVTKRTTVNGVTV